MASDILKYDRMVEEALRGVLRQALSASIGGLPGEHHFYITFRTRHPDVGMSEHLRARYPEEMTIVLQHQFWALRVEPDWFEVTLSFNRVNERLHIPFAAVSAFADPSAKFGLQFQVDVAAPPETAPTPLPVAQPEAGKVQAQPEETQAADGAADAAGAQVITLDAFRKK